MDFSQFLLNESYILSPYKICVANFICAFLDHRHYIEMLPYDSSSSLNINAHGHLTYKLIMSMDCSYEELLYRIESSNTNQSNISTEVLSIFHKEINRLRSFDIKHFYDFFDKIRSLVQKKFFKNRIKISDDSMIDQDQSASNQQIHKMSLIGIFLRKLIIYYERLSYCETSTLFDHLQNYLVVNASNIELNSQGENSANKENLSKRSKNCRKSEIFKDYKTSSKQIDLKILDKIEIKLSFISDSENFKSLNAYHISRQHLLKLIQKLRSSIQLIDFNTQDHCQDFCNNRSKRKLSSGNSSATNNIEVRDQSDSMDIEYLLETSTKHPTGISSEIDLDITLNDGESCEDDMSLDRTVFDHREKDQSSFLTTATANENVTIPKIEHQRRNLSKKFVNIYDTSEHYLVKQIYKIQYNEKLALTPQQVMKYLQQKFAQHNSFYYFRFITFNYLANLNLVRDGLDRDGPGGDPSSIPNGSSIPMVIDNRNNNVNTNHLIGTGAGRGSQQGTSLGDMNQLPGGGMSIQNNLPTTGGISSETITIDSLNKKYKSLFRSINFFNDIEYLKFINALRVNNYPLARKAFFDYFDLKKPSFEPDSDYLYFSRSLHSSIMPIMNDGTTGNHHIHANHHNANNLPSRAVDGVVHPGGGGPHHGGHHHHHQHHNNHDNHNQRSGHGGVHDPSGHRPGESSGTLNSNSTNYCWSSLNLAMMYAHFRYYRLAYDALVDCLSLAREKRDERCLQYSMLWILQISQHLDHSKTSKQAADMQNPNQKVYVDLDLMENIVGLILTNPMTLPYISAKTFLHFLRLQYLKSGPLFFEQLSLYDVLDSSNRQRRSPFLPQSFYLAIKYRLFDVLGEQFSTVSAILNAYGATHMAAMFAKLWLRMDVVETIMEERVFRLDENTPIAVRNLAYYLWFVRGDHRQALDLVHRYRKHFSSYNQRPQQILERALTEMMFERYANIGEWNAATKCLNLIRFVDRTRSYLMLAELRRRQNEPLAALECLDLILPHSRAGISSKKSQSSISKLSGATYFHENLFQSSDYDHSQDRLSDHEDHVILVPKTNKKKKTRTLTTPIDKEDYNLGQRSSKPIHLSNFQSNNLSFYERIQPPPPEELEPEAERPLIPELDPYTTVECHLMRGMILEDLSTLIECVAQSLSHGFKQLECRALVQIAHLQSEMYGQHHNAVEIMESVMHRLLSQATLRDLAQALYVYASVLYQMNRQQQVPSTMSYFMNRIFVQTSKLDQQQPILKPASILIKRSIILWEYIQDRQGLYESLRQASLIENDRNNLADRNFYAKRARMIRTTRM